MNVTKYVILIGTVVRIDDPPHTVHGFILSKIGFIVCLFVCLSFSPDHPPLKSRKAVSD